MGLTAFELQVYRNGAWKIDSVFDDKSLALFEAKRMTESGRVSAVRVVEETFDEDSGNSSIRVLFRGSKPEVGSATVRRAQASKPKPKTFAPKPPPPPPERQKRQRPKKIRREETLKSFILFMGYSTMAAIFILVLERVAEKM